jgi:hypothetical protein
MGEISQLSGMDLIGFWKKNPWNKITFPFLCSHNYEFVYFKQQKSYFPKKVSWNKASMERVKAADVI